MVIFVVLCRISHGVWHYTLCLLDICWW